MVLSILPLLVNVEDKFIRAPGHERTADVLSLGEKSYNVVVDGVGGYLNSGLVTLVLLQVMAVILYRMGYRLAAPSLGVITLGLFLARMFGAPA